MTSKQVTDLKSDEWRAIECSISRATEVKKGGGFGSISVSVQIFRLRQQPKVKRVKRNFNWDVDQTVMKCELCVVAEGDLQIWCILPQA